MHLLKTTAIATLIFVLASCQKEDATPKAQEEEICSVRRGSVDGTIIEGQYIVAYKTTTSSNLVTSARTSSFTTSPALAFSLTYDNA